MRYPAVDCSGGAPQNPLITLIYSHAEPNYVIQTTVPEGTSPFDHFADEAESRNGVFRLWRPVPGMTTVGPVRNPRSIAEETNPGQFVPSLNYTFETLFGAPGVPGQWSEVTLFLEAVKPSASACGSEIKVSVDFGVNNPSPPREQCTGPVGNCGLSDSVFAVAVRMDVYDLRWFEPRRVLSDDAESLAFDRSLLASRPRTQSVQGAITDGASVCLLTLTPCPADMNCIDIADINGEPLTPVDGEWSDGQLMGGLLPVQSSAGVATTEIGSIPALPSMGQRGNPPWRQTIDQRSGFAIYQPPTDFGFGSKETKEIAFGVRHRNENGSIFEVGRHSFTLRRPPLILVHGLFGDSINYWGTAAWNEEAGFPVPTRYYYPSFKSTNRCGYDTNFNNVPRAIRTALYDYRNGIDGHSLMSEGYERPANRSMNKKRYAATRADVVGHSMGGQIVRFYISGFEGYLPRHVRRNDQWEDLNWSSMTVNRVEPSSAFGLPTEADSCNWRYLRADNYFAGDIGHFVAIGSPFLGSPIGNEASDRARPDEDGEDLQFRTSEFVLNNVLPMGGKFSEYEANVPEYMRGKSGIHHAAVPDLSLNSAVQWAMEGRPNSALPSGANVSLAWPTGRKSVAWSTLAGRSAGLDSSWLYNQLRTPITSKFPVSAYIGLGAATSDGVVPVHSQLCGVESGAIHIFEGHQHSQGLGGFFEAETYSPSQTGGTAGLSWDVWDRFRVPMVDATGAWMFGRMGSNR